MQYNTLFNICNTLCIIIHYIYIYNKYNLTICRLGYVCNSRIHRVQQPYSSTVLGYMPQDYELFVRYHLLPHSILVDS